MNKYLTLLQSNGNIAVWMLLAIFFVLSHDLHAQEVNLEGIDQKDPIKVNGSMSLNTRVYDAQGIENRQDPLLWTLSGRLNFNIYGVSVPISGVLTSQNSEFQQPFNRIGIQPKYKWVKGHLGYSNMTFSEFTLGGHTFLGAGVELTPNKLRFAANYGRFATAIPFDQALNERNDPSFSRWGGGASIGYGTQENYMDFIFFSAEDRGDSWDSIPDQSPLTPGENMVMGIRGKTNLIKNLTLEGEYAQSVFNKDKRDVESSETNLFSSFGFRTRSSTLSRNAMKAQATYKLKGQRIGATYKRIAPDYQTMGAYFFNNDIQNITANYSTSILNKRLFIAVNGGYQNNNLDGNNASESTRTIGAANITYSKNPLTLGFTYSNFSSDVRFILNETLDSLNALIVTQTAGVNGTYSLKTDKGKTQVISMNISVQDVSDDFTLESRGTQSSLTTGTLNYMLKYPKSHTQISWRLNYTRMQDVNGTVVRIGPGVTYKELFLKDKLNVRLSVNYYNSASNNTVNTILGGGYKFNKHHILNFNASLIARFYRSGQEVTIGGETLSSYSETIVGVTYNYIF